MSLQTQITALIAAIASDIKTLLANTGNLANLTTANKTSLVNSLNELKSSIANIDLTSLISDATLTSTQKTYSIDKINAQIAAAVAALVNSAPGTLDTLKELADALTADSSTLSGLVTAVGNRVRFDAAQSLTNPEKITACQNLGIGDPTTDLAAAYSAAKV